MDPLLRIDSIHKVYGTGEKANVALESVSFDLHAGEVVTVVGPSGCGKTTLLRCISGLAEPTSGAAYLGGERITKPPAELGFVFQDYSRSLFPWYSVENNVKFPLRGKIPRHEIDERAERAIAAVGLDHAKDRKPFQLSGGMQQRVAIARALAYNPSVMLMDEPFASVDAQTRAELEDVVLATRDEFDMTVLFITHDIDEAVYLADRVVVLTPSPTTVREVVEVNLGRERDQITTKETDEFVQLRGHIYRSVKNRWDDESEASAFAASNATAQP